MPRPPRIGFEGAIYHMMNRGDRREPTFRHDVNRQRFLETLGEACANTDWQVHALCLMGNHLHLVVETPQANLVAGMMWYLGAYTARFNWRHKVLGHLFSGRNKTLVVDAAQLQMGVWTHVPNLLRAGPGVKAPSVKRQVSVKSED